MGMKENSETAASKDWTLPICKLPATKVAGVANPERQFGLFGLSLSD